MKKLIKYTLKFLQGDNGEASSRRLSGIILILLGASAKGCLMIYGAKIKILEKFTLYNNIDNSAQSLLIVGGLLLGATTVDKLKTFWKK